MTSFLIGFLLGFIFFPVGYVTLRYYAPKKPGHKSDQYKNKGNTSSDNKEAKREDEKGRSDIKPTAHIKHKPSLGSSGVELVAANPSMLNEFIDLIYRLALPTGSLEQYRLSLESVLGKLITNQQSKGNDKVLINDFRINTLTLEGLRPSLGNVSFRMASESSIRVKAIVGVGPADGSTGGGLVLDAQATCNFQLLKAACVTVPCRITLALRGAHAPVAFEVKQKNQDRMGSLGVKMAVAGTIETVLETTVVLNEKTVVDGDLVTNVVNGIVRAGLKRLRGVTFDLVKMKVVQPPQEKPRKAKPKE